jgi:glucosylceramidase
MNHVVTTPDHPWQPAKPASGSPSASPLPVLRPAGPSRQTVLGFGGCFNELGGRALRALPNATQDRLLADLFGPEGCRFDFCRLPIGASDYALSWYSHADVPGDYALAHHSIARDREWLLPYVHAAKKVRPDLRFFASPWSPPSWLKEQDRYNGSRLRDDPKVHATYAAYLLRSLRAWRTEGVDVSHLHVQNEPNSDQKFPSCLWTGAQMRDFIRDHLGPLFERERETCEIWAGTIERGQLLGWQPDTLEGDSYHTWLHTILADPDARRFIKGVGYQWNGKGALAQTQAEWPDLPIVQTENECGDGRNTWGYAFYVFDLLWQYFRHGCSAYVYWNMILPPGGESTWGWRQNALVTVDPAQGTVTHNPEFHVMRHVSRFVDRGATYVPLQGGHAGFAMLFINPDGTPVLVAANPASTALSLDLAVPGLPDRLHLPARSLSTLTG